MEIINGDSSIKSAEEILGKLEKIKERGCSMEPNMESISSLSLGNRDRWAENRKRLLDLGNTDEIHAIDSSMFLLVLDDFASPTSYESLKQTIGGPG